MAADKKTYKKKCKLIYEAYCARWGEGLRDEVIYPELGEQFFLEPKTIKDIVRKMRKLSQQAQPEIDFDNTEGQNNEAE